MEDFSYEYSEPINMKTIEYDPNKSIQEADIFNDEYYHVWFCDAFGYDVDTITCMEWIVE